MIRSFIIALLLLTTILIAEDEYSLGNGVKLGALPFYVGGYFSLDYKNVENSNRYRLDDIALLSYGGNESISYMLEVEFKDFYSEQYSGDDVKIERDQRLYLERVYLDFNINENYMLRTGKYNSSIGYWNLLPINVLRETTSNPITSSIIFPKFTTGIDLSYTSYKAGELALNVMLQHNPSLDDTYNNYSISEHYGLGVSYEKKGVSVKVNGGYFDNEEEATEVKSNLYYALVSAKYESESIQVMSEIGTQYSNESVTTRYAGYLQGLYRFTPEHIGVIRLESYDDVAHNIQDDMAIVAYTYRALYPIALKGEYQLHTRDNSNQLLFSFSVLF